MCSKRDWMLVHLLVLLHIVAFCHGKSLDYKVKSYRNQMAESVPQPGYYYPQIDGQPIYVPSIGHSASDMNKLLDDYYRRYPTYGQAWAHPTPVPYYDNSGNDYSESPVTSNSMVTNFLGSTDEDSHRGNYHILATKDKMKYEPRVTPQLQYDYNEHEEYEGKDKTVNEKSYEKHYPSSKGIEPHENASPKIDKVNINKENKDIAKKDANLMENEDEYEPPVVRQRINILKSGDETIHETKPKFEKEAYYEEPVVRDRVNIKKYGDKKTYATRTELEKGDDDYEEPVVRDRVNIKKYGDKKTYATRTELEKGDDDYEEPVVRDRVNIKKYGDKKSYPSKEDSELENVGNYYEEPVVIDRVSINKNQDGKSYPPEKDPELEKEDNKNEKPVVKETLKLEKKTMKPSSKSNVKSNKKSNKGKRKKQSNSKKREKSREHSVTPSIEKENLQEVNEEIDESHAENELKETMSLTLKPKKTSLKMKNKFLVKTKSKVSSVKTKDKVKSESKDSPVKTKDKVKTESKVSPAKTKDKIKNESKDSPAKTKDKIKTESNDSPVKTKDKVKTESKDSPVKTKDKVKTESKDSPVKTTDKIKTESKDSPVKTKDKVKSESKDSPAKTKDKVKTESKDSPVKTKDKVKTESKDSSVKTKDKVKTESKDSPVKTKDKVKPERKESVDKVVIKSESKESPVKNKEKVVIKSKPKVKPVKSKDQVEKVDLESDNEYKTDSYYTKKDKNEDISDHIEENPQASNPVHEKIEDIENYASGNKSENYETNEDGPLKKEEKPVTEIESNESSKPVMDENSMNTPKFLHDDAVGLSSLNANIWSLIFNPNAEGLELKKCLTRSNETGHCTYVQNCEVPDIATSLEQLLNNACVIDDIFIGVCCPEFPVQTVKVHWEDEVSNSVKQSEAEFDESVDDCGIRSNEVSKQRSWPWKAPLVSMSNGKIFCGGVIISENYVLTAAHCTTKIPKNQILVRLGQFDDSTGDDYAVVEIKRHAQYNPRTMHNDIALLKLGRRINKDEHTGIICLPDDDNDEDEHDGEKAILLGWKGMFGKSSNIEFLEIMAKEECRKKLRTNVPRTMLCTEARNENERTCNADSGAPLVIEDEGKYEVIGILSWNRNDCDERFPSTFSRVSPYVGWIRKHAV